MSVDTTLYEVAVRQLLSRFVADSEQWELSQYAREAEKAVDEQQQVRQLKLLTSTLLDCLQDLAWLRKHLQELAVAAGKDPAVFDDIGMGEEDWPADDAEEPADTDE